MSWLAVAVNDRSRFKREQRAHLADQRILAYSDFAASAKATMSTLFRVAAHHGVDLDPQPITWEDAQPHLEKAYHDREAAFERVRILAGDGVVAAARAWVKATYTMRHAIRNGTTSDAWAEVVSQANEQRDRFYLECKRELELLG